MRKFYLPAVIAAALMLSACISKNDLGFSRQGPDETTVKTNNPLILPPEYNVRPQSNKKATIDTKEDIDA